MARVRTGESWNLANHTRNHKRSRVAVARDDPFGRETR